MASGITAAQALTALVTSGIMVGIIDLFKDRRKRRAEGAVAERTVSAQARSADLSAIQQEVATLHGLVEIHQAQAEYAFQRAEKAEKQRQQDLDNAEERDRKRLARIRELEEQVDNLQSRLREMTMNVDELTRTASKLAEQVHELTEGGA